MLITFDRIGGVPVSMFCQECGRFIGSSSGWVKPKTNNWYLLNLLLARSTNE